MNSHAVAEAIVCSKSLARRRFRLSHVSVRSTTQRRGRTTKPLDVSDRLTISMVHLPIRRSAWRSLSPAYVDRRAPVSGVIGVQKDPHSDGLGSP
jgi:putative transposase